MRKKCDKWMVTGRLHPTENYERLEPFSYNDEVTIVKPPEGSDKPAMVTGLSCYLPLPGEAK